MVQKYMLHTLPMLAMLTSTAAIKAEARISPSAAGSNTFFRLLCCSLTESHDVTTSVDFNPHYSYCPLFNLNFRTLISGREVVNLYCPRIKKEILDVFEVSLRALKHTQTQSLCQICFTSVYLLAVEIRVSC
jgi:hypothetical protein